MNKISILKVLKPQGLNGELKCLPLTQREEVLTNLQYVFCDGKKITVISSKPRLGFVYICLENVASVEEAEKFRNKELFIEKTDFGDLDENTFFIDDLVGLTVVDKTGAFVGDILGVENYGAGDLLEVKEKWATYLVPFIKQVFVSVDVENNQVVIDYEKFLEHRA